MANTKNISVKVTGQEWEESIEKALDKACKKAKIDGFREGKAPKEAVLKKIGKESLYMEAADIVIEKEYEKMIKENMDLQIIAEPSLNLKSMDEKGLEFEFVLTLKPEVKLGQYKNLKVKKEDIEVSKEEIDKAILEMRSRYSENVSKDGKLEVGDTAIIDFEGFKNDVPFDGGKGENYSLEIGSNTFIPGFEDKLIGMEKEEERDIELSFPEDYHSEDLKGQQVVFKVKLNDIKSTVIPEIGPDFFEDLEMEGIDTLEGLENQVKENIEAQKSMQVENKYIDDLLDAASKDVEVEIPDVMIDDEIHRMMHQFEENLKMQGITLDMYYQFTNSDEEALKGQMKEEASKRVTYRFMLEEIIKVENIVISDEEASKELEEIAKKYQTEKEEVLKMFGGLEMIKYDLQMRKAIDILKG